MVVALDFIRELLIYCLYSAFLDGEYPVSLIIVAPPEHGKSLVLEQIASFPTVISVNFFSRLGLLTRYQTEIERGEKRTIVIPDLSSIMGSVSYPTFRNFLELLKCLMEEGIKAVHTKFIQLDFKRAVRMNVLTSIVPSYFKDKRTLKTWYRIGLIGRFLILSYTYKAETAKKIVDYIMRSEWLVDEIPEWEQLVERAYYLAKNPQKVIIDKNYEAVLYPQAFTILKDYLQHIPIDDKEKGFGFRIFRHLKTLCMARALVFGRKKVEKDDVLRICSFTPYMSLSFPKI